MSSIITRSPILITGGAGFIGANIVNRLLDLGYKNVNLIVKESTDLTRLKNVIKKINLHKADLLDKDLETNHIIDSKENSVNMDVLGEMIEIYDKRAEEFQTISREKKVSIDPAR
mgnify:CR=1 FL=1